MRETEEDVAARLAGSYSVNSDGEALILAGVRAGARAVQGADLIMADSYELGRKHGAVVSLESIAGPLRERAGVAFANGKDEEAKFFRDLANEFEEKARVARRAFEQEHQRPRKGPE